MSLRLVRADGTLEPTLDPLCDQALPDFVLVPTRQFLNALCASLGGSVKDGLARTTGVCTWHVSRKLPPINGANVAEQGPTFTFDFRKGHGRAFRYA